MFRQSKTLIFCAAALFACVTVSNANATDAASGVPAKTWHHPESMQHNLDKIHAELKLTADQEQQWQATLAASKAAHQQARAAHQQAHQQMQALMQAPVLDLRAMQSAREQSLQQAHQLHTQTVEAWLKFYDSLDTTQKTLVSSTLKARWQKMAAHHHKMMGDQ